MGKLKIDKNTSVTFEDGKPISVQWDFSCPRLREYPNIKKSVKAVEKVLNNCGFKIKLTEPKWLNGEDRIGEMISFVLGSRDYLCTLVTTEYFEACCSFNKRRDNNRCAS